MVNFIKKVKMKLCELEAPRFDETLSGAHIYDEDRIAPGVNLCDGMLITNDGHIVRRWNARYLSLLLPNGMYAAQDGYEACRWGMYTREDDVVWQKDEAIHHDIIFTPRQTLLTVTKEMHLYKNREVDFCVIIECNLNGTEIFRWSAWDNLRKIQQYHKRLALDMPRIFFMPETARRKKPSPWGGYYDYYRINSLQVLPKTKLGLSDARFREGNVLVSMRHGSMIFILDKDSYDIVWHCISNDVKNNLEGQHACQLLSSGTMLIFDNGRYREWSRVIEIDPVTFTIKWEYRSDTFFTASQGYAQRLANGNTLITESERGHVFEVTRDKKIVWEYYHPDVQSKENSKYPKSFGKRQWIYRMKRYPLEVNTPSGEGDGPI